MSLAKWIDLPFHGDARGSLVAVEGARDIPFAIQRVYYIFGTAPGVARGFHAHRTLKQVVVCISGKCRMVLDDGNTRQDVWLDSPDKGLFIDRSLWREMHDFTSDCVLMVLANAHYDESDYIRNYSDFLKTQK